MGCECNEPKPCQKGPCQEIDTECNCPVKDLSTDCSVYTGEDLPCSRIKKGTLLTELIKQLDAFICAKFNEVAGALSLTNIGLGANIYKGINNLGQSELRSITKSGDFITVDENPNDVSISVDEDVLLDFVQNNQSEDSTYTVNNIDGDNPSKVSLYKDSEATSPTNTQFNFKTLKTDSLIITEEDDFISIELEEIIEGQVRDFIVNTRYEGTDEKGTEAKPYKTLDAAIEVYIGESNGGTNINPQYINSRILCKGGQGHNFSENLSIRGLTLEVEKGTTIRYTGSELYPIDFRPLQSASGGYGTQVNGIHINIQGKGQIVTKNLLAYVVNSGTTVNDPVRYYNILTINGPRLVSLYKEDEFIEGINRSDGTPWIDNTRLAKIYFGGVEEAMIVSEGFSNISAARDNSLQSNLDIKDASIYCISQQVIEINSGFVNIEDSFLTNNFGGGLAVADPTNYNAGTNTLTEDTVGTYNLATYKPNLCLIEINGFGLCYLTRGTLATGFDISRAEAWYIINSEDASLRINDATNQRISGGIIADSFIKTGPYEPYITITNVVLNKSLYGDGVVLESTVPSYRNAVMDKNTFFNELGNGVDLTRGNIISVTNSFKNRLKESFQVYPTRVNALSVNIKEGDVYIHRQELVATEIIKYSTYEIVDTGGGTTDFTTVGAPTNNIGQMFEALDIPTGTGRVYNYQRKIMRI